MILSYCKKISLHIDHRFRDMAASRKFVMCEKICLRKFQHFREIRNKTVLRYARSSTVSMIDGLEKSQKSEASLPVG